ncbi:MAG: hypothetical protein Q8J68_14635 [Methanolobus sp.]|uniref:hypothetical protein n=1 Tax=Methanolobus sp. TaxID=1874737 RepID=UPI002731D927|nr:hypothetical protein [Methanolobus sp.]MDP2218511.1 hypothetical protein [Methanolobus sp.]
MNLCDNGHDEICYTSRKCPVCEIIKEKDEIIEELDGIVYDLKEQLGEATQ